MHSDTIGIHPLALRLGQASQVPIIGRQDDRDPPEEYFIRILLRGRLSKDGAINMGLQKLFVVSDELGRRVHSSTT